MFGYGGSSCKQGEPRWKEGYIFGFHPSEEGEEKKLDSTGEAKATVRNVAGDTRPGRGPAGVQK